MGSSCEPTSSPSELVSAARSGAIVKIHELEAQWRILRTECDEVATESGPVHNMEDSRGETHCKAALSVL